MLLQTVGERLRRRRTECGLTQAALSREAGVSSRFLVQLESGRGNISVQRLAGVCDALGMSLEQLFRGLGPGGPEKVSLVGLRGAGKSSIGVVLAQRESVPFVELDRVVEESVGMSLGQLFELRGEAGYRVEEDKALEVTLSRSGPMVIAAGGSIVTSPATWERLRGATRTVWLRASPESHLNRVIEQGDLRPMRGRPDALRELRQLLSDRAALYAQADVALDTDALGVQGVLDRLSGVVGFGRTDPDAELRA